MCKTLASLSGQLLSFAGGHVLELVLVLHRLGSRHGFHLMKGLAALGVGAAQ